MPRPKNSKYILIAILVITAAFFFYFPSYSRYRELKTEAQNLEAQLQAIQAQITELQREKQLMRNDTNYLESVIRKELGLVQPGEVVYEFEKQSSGKPASAASASSNSTATLTGTPAAPKTTVSKPSKTA